MADSEHDEGARAAGTRNGPAAEGTAGDGIVAPRTAGDRGPAAAGSGPSAAAGPGAGAAADGDGPADARPTEAPPADSPAADAARAETRRPEDKATAAGAPRRPARRGWARVAATVGVLGELLITAGLILALFVVYSLWWTNVVADRQAARRGAEVRESWDADRGGPGALDTKDGIGFLHVPAMSDDEILVGKGTDRGELNKGVAGYYLKPTRSAMPQDQSGNFTLAAHRDGHGAKFHNIDKIGKGDAIVFETKNTWFIYKVYSVLPETSKYNVDVLDDVPKESGRTSAGRYITLTTCTPVYTSTYRYVVWGELERTQDVDADRTPPRELR